MENKSELDCLFRIEYGKYNTNDSVMNLEFFKWYNIDLFANFTGNIVDSRKKI